MCTVCINWCGVDSYCAPKELCSAQFSSEQGHQQYHYKEEKNHTHVYVQCYTITKTKAIPKLCLLASDQNVGRNKTISALATSDWPSFACFSSNILLPSVVNIFRTKNKFQRMFATKEVWC